jgi:predicted HicB family RNase H-like nuclease
MRFISMSIRLVKDQYTWLKVYAEKQGESMNTIIRRALTDYKNRL